MESDNKPVVPETFTAYAASGAIAVRTTEQGQPVKLKIRPEELHRHPSDLAAEIMQLCRMAADRGALARRAQLEAGGLSGRDLAATNLPTADDVARRQLAYDDEYGAAPRVRARID